MLRLFVAIGIPDSVKDQLSGWRLSVRGARWVEPDQMHLTLTFLGEQPINVYREVCDSLETVAFAPFELRFQSVNFFGSKKVPRTLWADVCAGPELMTLQNRVSKRCRELGLSIEARKFRPHLTLARLNGASYQDVGRFLETLYLAQTDPFWIDSFQLFSSKLHPHGAVYRVERSFSSEGAHPVSL